MPTCALLSSACFGIALVTGRIGLRTIDARRGAAISIPSATLLFVLSAPMALDVSGFVPAAALCFALVGLIFPALVTLLTFRANEELGPTATAAVSATAPLFALLAAAVLLGESIPAQATAAAFAVAAGVVLLSSQGSGAQPRLATRALLWPFAGAAVRGLAQALVKLGLLLWPSAFAASLIGYLVSSVAVIGASRLGRPDRPVMDRQGIAWFVLTGLLNGAAVLLMYAALKDAPVSLVAPIVATYPLVTALTSALVLREEPVTRRMLAGTLISVAAIVWLIASSASG